MTRKAVAENPSLQHGNEVISSIRDPKFGFPNLWEAASLLNKRFVGV